MSKDILYSSEARKKLESGVMKVVRAVRLTMGPKGRNVILDRKYASPLITNDGVTIAKDITLADPFENMGANLVKQASIKTNDVAGDGTTTATLLAGEIIEEGLKNVAFGANPVLINKGIKRATDKAIECIKSISQPVTDMASVKNVATISASSPEIGELVAKAFERVGQDGTVTLGDSNTQSTHLEIVEGLSFQRGYLSPYFATDAEKMVCELASPLILITDKKIASISQLLPVLEHAMRATRPLLIIADDIEQDALSALVLNKIRGTLLLCAIKAPLFGTKRKEMLSDIATLTNGTYFDDLYSSFAELTTDMLGEAKLVKIGKDQTSIIAGSTSKPELEELKARLRSEIAASTDEFEKSQLAERLAKLSSGIAVVKVGGNTEAETSEKKLRIEDALNAVKASYKNGIVCGGGTAYLKAQTEVDKLASELSGEEKIGASIIAKALEAPFKQIVSNAGQDAGSLLASLKAQQSPTAGYDASKKQFVDMLECGIIDPALVEISALENASSVARAIISTECIVTDSLAETKQNEN